MSSKVVLTAVFGLSVTILSACGSPSGGKATFKSGRTTPIAGQTMNKLDCTADTAVNTTSGSKDDVCKKMYLQVQLNSNATCKSHWVTLAQDFKCENIPADILAAQTQKPQFESNDTAPNTKVTVNASTPEAAANALKPNTDPTDGKATGPATTKDAQIITSTTHADGTLDVQIPQDSELTAISSANMQPVGSTATPAVTPSTDTEACPKLKRINDKAKLALATLDIAIPAYATSYTNWSTIICSQPKTSTLLWTEIKSVFPTSSQWSEAGTKARCLQSVGDLARACSAAVKAGQPDVVPLVTPSTPSTPASTSGAAVGGQETATSTTQPAQ